MDTLEIELVDTNGKRKAFVVRQGQKAVTQKPKWTERGFGQSHTDFAEINGTEISGDLWRFFEGTLGIETLFKELTQENSDEELLEKFQQLFNKTSDDCRALEVWNSLLANCSQSCNLIEQ